MTYIDKRFIIQSVRLATRYKDEWALRTSKLGVQIERLYGHGLKCIRCFPMTLQYVSPAQLNDSISLFEARTHCMAWFV